MGHSLLDEHSAGERNAERNISLAFEWASSWLRDSLSDVIESANTRTEEASTCSLQ